jgi:tetratricopeptide (TPR) repeat protein
MHGADSRRARAGAAIAGRLVARIGQEHGRVCAGRTRPMPRCAAGLWNDRVTVRGLVLAALIVLSAGTAHAQHGAHRLAPIPIDLLERPIGIRTGIGRAHDRVSTNVPDAQAFYDQGLAYLHSYAWIDAARSFHAALARDPALAIAHVGLSYAYVELNKPSDARDAIEKARAAAAHVPDHDRRHIELRALQMAAEDAARDAAKLVAYRTALDAALAALPDDVELWLLRGIAESADPADRGQGSTASSMSFYERALTIAPDHLAAHHYLTHAHENAGSPAEALRHGAAYARLAPAVPHARHMHGHNLRRAGRVHDAIAEFEAADRLHRDWFAADTLPPQYDWHYHHNLDLLASSYQYVGQMNKAAAHYEAVFSLPSNLVVQLFNKRVWPTFLRSRGRIPEAFEAAKALMAHPHALIQATGHIEAGFAVLAVNQFADAAEQSNAALRILRSGAEGGPMAANALLALQGEIALRTAQREKGRQVFADVAKRLRAEPGPDNWVQALFALEAMARAARQVGDWELAGRMAQQMVEHDPSYAGSHYATALVAERNGDPAGARAAFMLAQTHWSTADAELPELAEIRRRLR